MPRDRSPVSWDWDDDRFQPYRDEYTEAELHRMEAERLRPSLELIADALVTPPLDRERSKSGAELDGAK